MREILALRGLRVPHHTRVHASGNIPEGRVGEPHGVVPRPGEEEDSPGAQHRRMDGQHLRVEGEHLPLPVNAGGFRELDGGVDADAARRWVIGCQDKEMRHAAEGDNRDPRALVVP